MPLRGPCSRCQGQNGLGTGDLECRKATGREGEAEAGGGEGNSRMSRRLEASLGWEGGTRCSEGEGEGEQDVR